MDGEIDGSVSRWMDVWTLVLRCTNKAKPRPNLSSLIYCCRLYA